jgi:hypothetical protein
LLRKGREPFTRRTLAGTIAISFEVRVDTQMKGRAPFFYIPGSSFDFGLMACEEQGTLHHAPLLS